MLGTVVALTLNFPAIRDQQKEVTAHAPAAILMASILFAAGSFTGIMRGTGMLAAMAGAVVSVTAIGLVAAPETLLPATIFEVSILVLIAAVSNAVRTMADGPD